MLYRISKAALASSAFCALALAACSPNALPTGYTYHQQQTYKSPAPGESSRFTEAQRETMNPQQADQFRLAVYQLAENLTRRAGMPPKPVYVVRPEKMTAFYALMDNDVRESLRHLGYTLSDTPAGAYPIAYAAQPVLDADGKVPPRAAGDTSPNVIITLYVYDSLGENGRLLTEESGSYFIQGAETLIKGNLRSGGGLGADPVENKLGNSNDR